MAIQYAKGKYLYFLDSDDYIELNTIEIMVNYAEKYHTDVVNASPRIVLYETGEVLPAFTYPSFKMIKGKDEFAKFVCQDLKWHIGVASWNNLFLMSFLIQNNLFFLHGRMKMLCSCQIIIQRLNVPCCFLILHIIMFKEPDLLWVIK